MSERRIDMLRRFVLISTFVHGLLIHVASGQNELFKIERSKDPDVVQYEVNMTEDGDINLSNPIKVFWIRYTNNAEKEPLTWIQQALSYGIRYDSISETQVVFHFAAYKKRKLYLKKVPKSGFIVWIKSNERWVVLNKIYIELDGGSFLVPHIPFIKVCGTDVEKVASTKEVIYPTF